MAEIYRFFDSVTGDTRTYNASDYADYFNKFVPDGLHVENGKLAVTADGTTMKTTVATGTYFIKGRMYTNTANLQLTHDTAEASLDRIDRIVLRCDTTAANRFIKLFIKKGTPASSPVAPALINDSFITEIAIAQVRIVAGRTFITQAEVTDQRPTTYLDPVFDGTRLSLVEGVSFNKQSYVNAVQSTSVNLPVSTYTKLTPPEVIDSQGEYSNGIFVPKVSGRYMVYATVDFTNIVSAWAVQLFLYRNGAQFKTVANSTTPTTYSFFPLIGTFLGELYAGDSYEIYGYQNGNQAATIGGITLRFIKIG
ncbi:hypothetical protein [Fictibacillus sp. 26RED30]|uniref:hypothetical protein n=1 Tax=Fictibacillus sp. 26RED30 TaxID=2745877 RepID=UPI0018CEFACC|nr:hypothetical protein [Fictibacillus sp. 26RED30]MBH0159889.1 hypothetical protein [Fictibacillus sp. 26RED30]